jgi:hypothetical protein
MPIHAVRPKETGSRRMRFLILPNSIGGTFWAGEKNGRLSKNTVHGSTNRLLKNSRFTLREPQSPS